MSFIKHSLFIPLKHGKFIKNYLPEQSKNCNQFSKGKSMQDSSLPKMKQISNSYLESNHLEIRKKKFMRDNLNGKDRLLGYRSSGPL